MKQDQLLRTATTSAQEHTLKEQLAQLQEELNELTQQVDAFERLLLSQLTNELIEEQELAIRYKSQKAEKKAKRLAQKRRGKNYVAPVGLKLKKKPAETSVINEADAKEKKRLYREAMLHVHPDKFSMHDDQVDLATELTTRLVEIYQQEDLATLVAYHAHLFSHTDLPSTIPSTIDPTMSPDAYLEMEKAQVEKAIEAVKNKHSYHVLTTYENPSSYANELRAYYHDRIQKLRRRTRTK